IKIAAHDAMDDITSVLITEQNEVSVIKYDEDYGFLGLGRQKTVTKTFEIAEHDNDVSATLNVNATIGTRSGTVVYTLTNTTTGDVFTQTVSGGSLWNQEVELNVSLDKLPAG